MKKYIIFLFLGLGLISFKKTAWAQTDTIPLDFCISSEEYQLVQLINDYRKAFALEPISLSKSLSYVAITHARDLAANFQADSACTMSSWSDQGRWKPICYPKDQTKKNDIRQKAEEIIGYPGKAYEITYWSNVEDAPRQILSFWREHEVSADLLLNRAQWESFSWKAIGVGIEDGYAVVWLGQDIDYEVSTSICGSNTKVLNDASPEYKATHAKTASKINKVYYITIGSYQNRKDGVNAVKSYKEMGYPRAVLVEMNDKIRVAIDYFTDKAKADQALKKYARKFKGAWILTL